MFPSWNASSSNHLVFVFDSDVYICNAQRLFPKQRDLKYVGKLYDAFSVHKKGQSPPPRTLPEATDAVDN